MKAKQFNNLKELISSKRTLLVVLDEDLYEKKITELLKSLGKIGKKICYVSLNKPYKDIVEDFKENDIPLRNFFFVDVLSSHYIRPEPTKNCVFVSAPTDLHSIIMAILKTIKEERCEIIIFDTLSTFLIYRQPFVVLKFVYRLLQEELREDLKKIFITIRGGDILDEEREQLIKDVMMFADMLITFEKNRKEF